jgi:hypothetical protein
VSDSNRCDGQTRKTKISGPNAMQKRRLGPECAAKAIKKANNGHTLNRPAVVGRVDAVPANLEENSSTIKPIIVSTHK